jgi:hypothetical protein
MPDPIIPVSPSGSMVGWSFVTLLKKNKDKVKLLVSAVGAFVTAQLTGIQDPALNTLASTFVGVLIYIAGAAVDYWLTDDPGQADRVDAALAVLVTKPQIGDQKGGTP